MGKETANRDLKTLVSSIAQEQLDERSFSIQRTIAIKGRRRRYQKRIAFFIALAALFAVGGVFVHESTKAPPAITAGVDRVTRANASKPQGPKVKALAPGTQFTSEETPSHHTYHLETGILRFETGENGEKPLIVRVGELLIEDIGTIFTVERLPDDRARISITAGMVRVTWPNGTDILEAEEIGTYPPLADEAMALSKSTKNGKHKGRIHTDDWRLLARRGKYQQAFEILFNHPQKVDNRVEDLLLAADVMRFSGRPDRAVKYLESVIRRHVRDPRSSLAAFTLGRVFLDELGRPLKAAGAFGAARKAGGPLAEKALAREVEAWSRAGEMDRAKQAAKQYLRQYPTGDRVDIVRAFGGVDEP